MDGNRLTGACLRLEFLNYLARVRESACLVLGEHKFVICDNVKDAVMARAQLCPLQFRLAGPALTLQTRSLPHSTAICALAQEASIEEKRK